VGSNLTSENVASLHNTYLGLSATITINSCTAGLGGKQSIAQLLANQLRRKVYAYQPGMFFSVDPHAPAPPRDAKGNPLPAPNQMPMYMVPWGAVPAKEFKPE
jgi:hypothetical protein